MWLFCLCVDVHTVCVPATLRGYKRASDPLELELEKKDVSPGGAKYQTQILWKSNQRSLLLAISPVQASFLKIKVYLHEVEPPSKDRVLP